MSASFFRHLLCLPAFGLALSTSAIAQDGAPQQPPPAVVVAPATMTALESSVSFTGRLVASQQVEIRARVTGFLESVDFVEGAEVAAGAQLFQIEDDSYAAALNQVEGQIVSAEAERDLANLERDRQAELVARDAAPQRNLDQANAAIGTAEGTLVMLNAEKKQAALNLSYTKIAAPFAGIVGLTQYDVGALVAPDTGSLVTLTQSDPIYADFAVSTRVVQNYREAVRRGEAPETATVSLRLANGSTYADTGDVSFIDNVVSEGTDTILVRAVFDNPDHDLRDGEFVVVVLQTGADTQVLAVPAQAVSRDIAGAFVMAVDDQGVVARKQVDTGPTTGGLTEILGGLDEGELVITEGLNKVRPGITVDAAQADVTPQDQG